MFWVIYVGILGEARERKCSDTISALLYYTLHTITLIQVGIHGGHGGSRFLHFNMLSLGFFLILLSKDLLIKTMLLSIIPDLASWSPCPSWPSEPRPQLHTSVSRDGSPSKATSSPVAWVWPPGDGLQAQGRCRRGDPERKPQNLKEASCYQCCFESTSHCDMLRTWQICMIHTITFNKSYSRQKKNKHVSHMAPRPKQLRSVQFTFYMGKHTYSANRFDVHTPS